MGHSSGKQNRAAAFFDFDNTLLAVDSAHVGIRWLYRQKEVSTAFVVNLWLQSKLFGLHLLSAEHMTRTAIRLYEGHDPRRFRNQAADFWKQQLKPHLSPLIAAELEQHRAKGHLPALITAAPRYLMEPVGVDLGIEHLICTDLEIGADGRFTGRPIEPPCIGKHKPILARQFAQEQGIDMAQSSAYSDHHSDLPLLESVGHPVAVAPTPPLRRQARKRGWPIMAHR